MIVDNLILLSVAIAIIACLYSSVGHAGASGYIAVMSLFGMTPPVIKPAALVLNILVACLATWQFWKAGHFSWKTFWPFAVTSVPMAFIGGYVTLPSMAFKFIVGVVLLYSAFRFLLRPGPDDEARLPAKAVALSVGGALGLLSGLTGVGGGIFLTPLMIFMRWARTKTASAVSALFILVNSIAGLTGNLASTKQLPLFAIPLVVSAFVGGSVGSYFGSRRFEPVVIKRLLGVVLFIAGVKLILT